MKEKRVGVVIKRYIGNCAPVTAGQNLVACNNGFQY